MSKLEDINGDRIVMSVKARFDGPAKDDAHFAERVRMMDRAKEMRRILAGQIGETLALDHPVGTMAHFDVSTDDLRYLNALRAVAREFGKHAANLASHIGDDDLRDYLTDSLTKVDEALAEGILPPRGDGEGTAYTFQYPTQE